MTKPCDVDDRAVVHPDARLGAGCQIGPFAMVEAGCEVGEGTILEPLSRIVAGTVVGRGCRIAHGAVVGGFPQVTGLTEAGSCVVGDHVVIGEYATLHAGSAPGRRTTVGDEVMLMAYAHVGHDVLIGPKAIIANAVQLAGGVHVGWGAVVGGTTAIHQGTRLGDLCFVGGGLRIDRDVAPWSRALGEPARWAGINRLGMERAGWDRARRLSTERHLKTLFRGHSTVEAALEVLMELEDPDALALVRFVQNSRRGLLRPRV